MTGIARTSANQGRLRPSFFLLLLGCGCALAQQPVFRCGQEYTNAPVDERHCERLSPQPVTVIEGTRVQAAGAGAAQPAATAPSGWPAVRVEPAGQKQRDEMARTIVATELDQARQRHAQLLRDYREAETQRSGDEERKTPKPGARAEQLRTALERAQRDIDSLQRELDRHSARSSAP